MKPKTKEVRLPKLRMEANLEPGTLDQEARTVQLRWYSGATVDRYSFFDGPYKLTFAMEPKNVRLGRLSSGSAPLKGGHVSNSDLGSVVGVIQKAWLEKGEGRATVRFSKRSDVEPFFQDVQDGILRNVSMEAVIHELDDVTEKGDEIPHFLAVDWEPHAVALVAVGADPNAQMLDENAEKIPCRINLSASAEAEAPKRAGAPKEKAMKIKVRLSESDEILEIEEDEFDSEKHVKLSKEDAPALRDPKSVRRRVDDELERKQAFEAEVKRVGAAYGLDAVWVRRHINLGTDIDQVIELAKEERAKRAPQREDDLGFGNDRESQGWRAHQMAEALAARAANREIPEKARQYAETSLIEMALECLSWHGLHHGLSAKRHSARILELALTTADYPNLLANAANKILQPDYEHATPTYRLLAERQDLPDFKTASVLKAGDFPVPLQVAEEGEIKLGSFSEAKDTFALATYGRRLLFAFQSIVNDDLGAFARIMRSAAVRLADFENALWFALLTSGSGAGPTLGDSVALFHTTHANLTSSGTAISVDSLGVGRAMMRKQTSLDGLKLNIVPRYILTSPDKETLARQYTTVIGANVAPASQNPWAGTLEPIADANLTTANPWYLFADPMRAPVSVYGYLQGQAGPNVATRQGFEVLGVEMRVALHFGVAFTDFRGAYRNAGA